ncbi:unnamed protein product, partial [Closterium sp. NIES-54]
YALPSPCLWPSQVPALPPVLTSPGVPSLRRGRQCVAPHSSEFPPTTAPLQTLHMDRKMGASGVLIPWIRATRRQLRDRFSPDFPVLRPHSVRGVDFAARTRLDYVTSLVTESESVCPPSVGGEPALSSDVLEDRQFELQCLVAALPRFPSKLLWPEGGPDALDIPTPRSYAEAITGQYSSPTTLAALGIAPSSADPSLFLRIDTTLPPFYLLVYVDDLVFATTDSKALALVLQRFNFQFSSPQPTPLSTGHSLSAPPSDESVEPSGLYLELVGCLIYLMTCTRPDLAYPLSLLARYVARDRHRKVTQRSSQGYTFSLCYGSVSWRSARSSSVLGSNCKAGIYAEAMVALELRRLTYLLIDLGERPRSPPSLEFGLQYAVHQLNLWPRISEPETSSTLRWTGKFSTGG